MFLHSRPLLVLNLEILVHYKLQYMQDASAYKVCAAYFECECEFTQSCSWRARLQSRAACSVKKWHSHLRIAGPALEPVERLTNCIQSTPMQDWLARQCVLTLQQRVRTSP